MAKSKKNRQKDFGKVKLKVGKKLKKGENVTNASFRTRSVQITQHLKSEKTSGPITKKRQNIQEVFAHCRHYNANVRQEAVNGLREIVTAFPDVLTTHLSDILEKSSEHLSDKEASVRQGSLRLFKAVLPRIPEKQVSPFFAMVCAHLCCAMTHINTDIQLDSLSTFDLLLEHYPKLIISKAGQVMTNFIEQISRQKGEGQRSLSTNLGQKMTSMKWRTSVLGRVEKFLMAFRDYHSNNTQSLDIGGTMDVLWFSEHDQIRVQVFPAFVRDQWENQGFTLRSLNENADTRNSLDGNLTNFVDMLVPLLLECWIEASHSQQTTVETSSVLIPETVAVLSSILNVTKLLWECVDSLQKVEDTELWHTDKHMKDFQQRLLEGFPYSLQEFVTSLAGKKAQDGPSSIAVLNLSICEIMTQVLPDLQVTSDSEPRWLPDVLFYLRDFLSLTGQGKSSVGPSCKTVVKIVEKLLKYGVASSENSDYLSEVMNAMFKRFKGANHLSQEKKVYLKFFSDVIFDPGSSSKISDELQDKFLRCLPELFPFAARESSSMTALLIQSMRVAACRNCLSFLDTTFFSKKGVEWFGDKTGAVINLTEESQRDLLSLLYYVPNIDINMIKLFTNLVRSERVSDRNVSYLIQLLHNRFIHSSQTDKECSIHLSFLVNLLLGNTEDVNMSEVNMDTEWDCTVGKYRLVDVHQCTNNTQTPWKRHEYLVQEASKVIKMFENSSQVKTMVLSYTHKYLVDHSFISQESAVGICKLSLICDAIPPEVLTDLVQLTLSILISCVRCDSGSEVVTLSSLQTAACDLLGKIPGAFCRFLSDIEVRIKGSPEDDVTILLKVCLHTLREEYRKTLLTNSAAVDVLKHIIGHVTIKDKKSMEIETLVADLEYRCSTASLTIG